MTNVNMSVYAKTQYESKYAHTLPSGRKEVWEETSERVITSVVRPYLPEFVGPLREMMEARAFIPGGRYLSAAGRRTPFVTNCYLFDVDDSREGWADLMHKITNALMTGGGVGVVYSRLRPGDTPILGLGGTSTGPLALMHMVNEAGRYVMQGGSRRSAIWAGLHWWHPDVTMFMHMKEWSADLLEMKQRDFMFPAPMEGTNISVILDSDFMAAMKDPNWRKTYRLWGTSFEKTHADAQAIYADGVRLMRRRAEPGFSIDVGANEGENLRNACTELCSRDDGDNCNLSSLNMGAFRSISKFAEAVRYGTAFLLCGSKYGLLPMELMRKVREKNRRIGLGLMGIHEWLLKRSYPYAPNGELSVWMKVYQEESDAAAKEFASKLDVAVPIGKRAIAPTGTISIVAETSSGAEPITAVAYLRRYLKKNETYAQYVIDPTAHRLIQENGVRPEDIEDAMSLAGDIERRVRMQAFLQRYVDHGISSTINLPEWDEKNGDAQVKQLGDALLPHLFELRGITAYPDGSRGGQPFTRVPYHEAAGKVGVEFRDQSEKACRGGFCNS